MNDPNGLIYHDGLYHLFFQYNPFGSEWGHMSWGHAVSPDLFRWEERPIALLEEADLMMFSGSAVFDARNTSGLGVDGAGSIVLAYTGHSDARQIEHQNLAFSNDAGQTFTKYEGNPVLDLGARDFRDPQVFWHEATQRWIMVVGYRLRIGIYGSDDLIHWSPLSEFRPDIPDDSPSCECPQLVKLPVDGDHDESRWLLAMSIAGSATAGGSGMLYEVGHFDGRHFMVTEPTTDPKWVDFGADFFAAQSFTGLTDGRCIWIGWMSNWRYANQTPTNEWRGAMSLPREVSLTRRSGRLKLRQHPVRELDQFRQAPHVLQVDSGSDSGEPDVIQINGATCDIVATLQPGKTGRIGIRLGSSPSAWTDIGYDPKEGALFLDRTQSGIVDFHDQFAAVHHAPIKLNADSALQIRIVVDACSAEVFAEDGTVVLTDLVYPSSDRVEVALFSEADECRADVTIYPLSR